MGPVAPYTASSARPMARRPAPRADSRVPSTSKRKSRIRRRPGRAPWGKRPAAGSRSAAAAPRRPRYRRAGGSGPGGRRGSAPRPPRRGRRGTGGGPPRGPGGAARAAPPPPPPPLGAHQLGGHSHAHDGRQVLGSGAEAGFLPAAADLRGGLEAGPNPKRAGPRGPAEGVGRQGQQIDSGLG